MNLSKGRRFVTLALGFAMGVPVLGPEPVVTPWGPGRSLGQHDGLRSECLPAVADASEPGIGHGEHSKTQIVGYIGDFGGPDFASISGSAWPALSGNPIGSSSVQSRYETADAGTLAVPFQVPAM